MLFGNQTVTFVSIALGDADDNGVREKIRTPMPVSGCRFRPLRAEEKVGLVTVATEVWKLTAPPDPAVLSAESVDEVLYEGDTYQIVGGVQPFTDQGARLHKVTVLCEKQKG